MRTLELIISSALEPHLNLNLNCKAEEFTMEEFFSEVSELFIFNNVEDVLLLWAGKDKVVFVSLRSGNVQSLFPWQAKLC